MPYKDKEKARQHAKQYRIDNPDVFKKMRLKQYWKNPDKIRKYVNAKNAKIRSEVITSYGSKCVCCNENEEAFLGIDHINNDGAEHRREIGGSGSKLYKWLRKNNYPQDRFRLLCHNCNGARHSYRKCVHEAPIAFTERWHGKAFRLKSRVIGYYGDKCCCCGEDELAFLTIDHIDGDGKNHRKIIGGGSNFYYWLQRSNYPAGFRVMCFNCNQCSGVRGKCAHLKMVMS